MNLRAARSGDEISFQEGPCEGDSLQQSGRVRSLASRCGAILTPVSGKRPLGPLCAITSSRPAVATSKPVPLGVVPSWGADADQGARDVPNAPAVKGSHAVVRRVGTGGGVMFRTSDVSSSPRHSAGARPTLSAEWVDRPTRHAVSDTSQGRAKGRPRSVLVRCWAAPREIVESRGAHAVASRSRLGCASTREGVAPVVPPPSGRLLSPGRRHRQPASSCSSPM